VATPAGHIQLVAPRRFGDGFAKAEVGACTYVGAGGLVRAGG
jgi:hypothetical protein